MRRVKFDSTAIVSAGYDPETAVLEIEFTSGGVYRYRLVPPHVWRELREAESAGRYFGERIRDRFPEEWVP
ncbi:KTSC domain-containing protein [Leifsonia sp. McL0607]|uniref:KTSC domain-containing protein n=1 Tax=Leifsonia sp. McL0607 TaxID=3415672 RepID=UPI003CEB30B5